MAAPRSHGPAGRKNLRVLLPFSCGSLRIPDELAEEIGAGEALVVGPSGGRVKFWPVKVGQDGDGAFLGHGWPEFADACGVGAGWFLVLRHRGCGVLTVKAFDSSCCLRELAAHNPAAAAEATTSSKDASRRPQFISVLLPDSTEKMQIPAKFVQQYIPKEHMSNRMAIVFGPLGKVYPIELEMSQSDMFFAGGWSQFMTFHGITEANDLLLRYEGNMVFTIKVFEPDGCQRESKHKDDRMKQNTVVWQEAPSASTRKCKSADYWPSSEGEKKPKVSVTPSNKASLRRTSSYEIGPPTWIKKQINGNTLENELALAKSFCYAIGLREQCNITLKTSMNSTKSWQVHGFPGKNRSYLLTQGWTRFCQENSLKEGDICTFNVIETKLWHVIITRYKENINHWKPLLLQVGSVTARRSHHLQQDVFEIGPPAWLKEEINACTIEKHMFATGLLRGNGTPRTLHDHPQDLNEQYHVLAGASCPVQE
ncbi:hypothetical protein ACP70R_001949 [Stipagrostis hirtigluma subsp. patula]